MDYVRLHTAARERERERERETEESIHNLEITVAAAKLLNYNLRLLPPPLLNQLQKRKNKNTATNKKYTTYEVIYII